MCKVLSPRVRNEKNCRSVHPRKKTKTSQSVCQPAKSLWQAVNRSSSDSHQKQQDLNSSRLIPSLASSNAPRLFQNHRQMPCWQRQVKPMLVTQRERERERERERKMQVWVMETTSLPRAQRLKVSTSARHPLNLSMACGLPPASHGPCTKSIHQKGSSEHA